MRKNLERLGVSVEELPDGIIINGKGYITGSKVKGYEDHRIIMAMAIAGLYSKSEITIDDISAVSVTFPTFFELIDQLKDSK